MEIGFGGQYDSILGPEQRLVCGGVSFYLSFVDVAIVCSFLGQVSLVVCRFRYYSILSLAYFS